MHFAFVNMPIEYYSPISGGAIATVILNNARELIARGHKVSVLTVVNADETYAVGEVIPIKVKTRDDLHFFQRRLSSLVGRMQRWDWPYFEFYLRSVTRSLARLSTTPHAVVLFNDLASPKHIKRVLPDTRVVVSLHNEWRTRHNVAETVQHTDFFLTCSDYIKRWTADAHNIPPAKLVVAQDGVDLEAFQPRPAYLDDSAVLRVLCIGRIDPNKGADIAADAVATLQSEGHPISLTVAGGVWFYGNDDPASDPYFRKLEPKMRAARADYLGHVTRANVPALIRRHDVVMVLSRSQEPFGLVALEAMASGCAVIASNRGGLPEACGGAAILVDPDDFVSVVAALRSLAANPALLKTLKRKAVERAARAGWSVGAETLEQSVTGHVALSSC